MNPQTVSKEKKKREREIGKREEALLLRELEANRREEAFQGKGN